MERRDSADILSGMQLTVVYANRVRLEETWQPELDDALWRLYRNEQPGMVLIQGRWRFPVPPRRLVLVPPFAGLRGEAPAGIDHTFLHCSLPEADRRWLRRWMPRPVAVPMPDGSRRLPSGDQLPVRLRMQAVAADAFAAVLSTLPGTACQELADQRDRLTGLRPALDYIDDHLDGDLDLAVLAGVCHTSPDRFGRVFARLVGEPPAAYVRRRRCLSASDQLRRTDAAIPAIAAQVGFANRYHFTRVFTAIMGRSPASYRRLAQAAQ